MIGCNSSKTFEVVFWQLKIVENKQQTVQVFYLPVFFLSEFVALPPDLNF